MALINTYVAIHSIDCVMASDIDSQALLHELTPHVIGAACFPTSSNEVLHLLHDKWQFHQLLKAHGLPAPRTILLQAKRDVFGQDVYSLQFPVVVKTLGMQAGEGVIRANHIHELANHVYGNHLLNSLPLLVQEFVPGLDAGFSLLAINGRIVTSLAQQYEPDGSISIF
jgi:glutathione synthase/RimK-type ligase-like ATP-grasp enzyme